MEEHSDSDTSVWSEEEETFNDTTVDKNRTEITTPVNDPNKSNVANHQSSLQLPSKGVTVTKVDAGEVVCNSNIPSDNGLDKDIRRNYIKNTCCETQPFIDVTKARQMIWIEALQKI